MPRSQKPAEVFPLSQAMPFSLLSLEEWTYLAQKLRTICLEPGEAFYLQGQEEAQPAYLLHGLVKLCASAPKGKECVLHLIRPLNFIDAAVLFYEGSLPCSAIAVTEAELTVFDRASFLEIVAKNAAFSLALLKVFATRQRLFINKLAGSQGKISVACRVSSWLLHRARMEQQDQVAVEVNRELLARLLGVTRESFSRELSRLQEEGTIKVERHTIVILDKNTLQKNSLL